jgi:hypothetical protein
LARTILIPLFLIVLCTNISGQVERKSNIEVFDDIISSGFEKIYYYPGLNRNFEFIFIVNSDKSEANRKRTEDINRYLVSLIKKTASANNLRFSIAPDTFSVRNDSGYNIINLKVFELETKYSGFKKNKFLGDKTMERNIKVNIGVNITPGNAPEITDRISGDYRDEVNYDNYEELEASQYIFTHGKAPNISSIETIVFPVLLIVVSAAATILFFTIRSK